VAPARGIFSRRGEPSNERQAIRRTADEVPNARRKSKRPRLLRWVRGDGHGKVNGLHHLFVVLTVAIVGVVLWAASPIVTLVFVAWLLFTAGGYVIGEPKGRGAAGILLGSFGGPIGLLIVATIGPSQAVRTAARAGPCRDARTS